MEEWTDGVKLPARVVAKETYLSSYDAPRWITLRRRDVDWDAVDFSWIFYDRNRLSAFGVAKQFVRNLLNLR